jgi:hypothetical protein
MVGIVKGDGEEEGEEKDGVEEEGIVLMDGVTVEVEVEVEIRNPSMN